MSASSGGNPRCRRGKLRGSPADRCSSGLRPTRPCERKARALYRAIGRSRARWSCERCSGPGLPRRAGFRRRCAESFEGGRSRSGTCCPPENSGLFPGRRIQRRLDWSGGRRSTRWRERQSCDEIGIAQRRVVPIRRGFPFLRSLAIPRMQERRGQFVAANRERKVGEQPEDRHGASPTGSRMPAAFS